MANLYAANRQWSSRPADERFWNVSDLLSSLEDERASSRERALPLRSLSIDSPDGENVSLIGPAGVPARLTNWSFGQLSRLCSAPPSYLSTLPAPLAVQALRHGWKGYLNAREEDANANLLTTRGGDGSALSVRSFSSEIYGRIWDHDVAKLVEDYILPLGWMTPPARPSVDDPRARPATASDVLPNQGDFGLSVRVGDLIAPAGVYRGDRDMFLFLVNPTRIIDDGGKGLMRGVFVQNSEVGGGALKLSSFYLENVCGNHIVWGASEVRSVKIVHKKNAVIGFDGRLQRSLADYTHEASAPVLNMIQTAKGWVLGRDEEEVTDKVTSLRGVSLTRKEVGSALALADEWQHTYNASPYSAWGLHHGLTRLSQTLPNANERHSMDVAASKILACVGK